MGFQDVKLPSSLISEMYKTVLIEEPGDVAGKTEEEQPVEKALTFLGSNGRNISLIAGGKKPLVESAPETQFLLKILQACSLSMKDIALFDLSQIRTGLKAFVHTHQPEKVLLFASDINSEKIPAELLFQLQKEGNTEILYAPAVQDLMKDSGEAVQLKKKLWSALKNFFNV
jgi:hypothetical protein